MESDAAHVGSTQVEPHVPEPYDPEPHSRDLPTRVDSKEKCLPCTIHRTRCSMRLMFSQLAASLDEDMTECLGHLELEEDHRTIVLRTLHEGLDEGCRLVQKT